MNLIVDKSKENTTLPAVMRAAIHLFVARGIDGATTKDIARAAGVAEGSLYRHFKSKEDLAWTIFSVHLNQFATQLMGKVLPVSGARERIRIFVAETFQAYEEDQDLFTYLIIREHTEFKRYPRLQNHPGLLALNIIEEGQKKGEIKTGDRYVLGGLLIGGLIRICVLKMYGNLGKALPSYADDVSASLWAMLRKEPNR